MNTQSNQAGSAIASPCTGPSGDENFFCDQEPCQVHLRDVAHKLATQADFEKIVKAAHNGRMPSSPEVSKSKLDLQSLVDPAKVNCHNSHIEMLPDTGGGFDLVIRPSANPTSTTTISIGLMRGIVLLVFDKLEVFEGVNAQGDNVLAFRAMIAHTPIYFGNVTELIPLISHP